MLMTLCACGHFNRAQLRACTAFTDTLRARAKMPDCVMSAEPPTSKRLSFSRCARAMSPMSVMHHSKPFECMEFILMRTSVRCRHVDAISDRRSSTQHPPPYISIDSFCTESLRICRCGMHLLIGSQANTSGGVRCPTPAWRHKLAPCARALRTGRHLLERPSCARVDFLARYVMSIPWHA